jgi:aminopeptidase YwaD
MQHFLLFLFYISFSVYSYAQKLSKNEKKIMANVKSHVMFLAKDELQGRRTGTIGADMALEYITQQFVTSGLEPKGTEKYIQSFIINDGVVPAKSAACILNGHDLALYKEWFPLSYSATTSFKELVTTTMKEYGMPWFYDIQQLIKANKNNPHAEVSTNLYDFAKKAQADGCKGLIVYNSAGGDDAIAYTEKESFEKIAIPIMYIKNAIYNTYLKNQKNAVEVNVNIAFENKTRTGKNAIGFINNNAKTTVVIGAHYDHLGFGEDNNSRYTGASKEIHNGADDNASGTAALIELAQLCKTSKLKNNNYLFIAFSGEELGLLGSKYFLDNATIDVSTINYMINMDMIGRLSDSTKTLTIGGIGTSNIFTEVITNSIGKAFMVKYDSSGTGPSDHNSFYRKNIPVLFFFTGLHTDYHTPTDDAEKINYEGETFIITAITTMIKTLDKKEKLTFLKTREQAMGSSKKFKVTLGIMPDYAFSGPGVRVDGVIDQKPAKLAGVLQGDIITKMGTINIAGMESYMNALSSFEKGSTTTIEFMRNGKLEKLTVTF